MRKIVLQFSAIIAVCLCVVQTGLSQEKKLPNLRCGTMEHLYKMYERNPDMKSYNDKLVAEAEKMKQDYIKQQSAAKNNEGMHVETLTGPVTIPVVVHIVLPNSSQISDADVQAQINKLNIDFAGLNADSVNIPAAFKPLFGKSKLRFALARRDPSGNLTSGIERKNSATRSDANLATDPIKRASLGGLDAWDYTKYLNLWVGLDGSGLGVLGYATFPGQFDAVDNQGVFINALSFGANSCYVLADYNLGRTMVHEVGHYFGLLHIWGDEDACAGDDFRPIPVDPGSPLPGCTLPAALLIGDTPNQTTYTDGCPTGIKVDACSPTAPGIMYQNYMDYTGDNCYTMFTLQQVARMEWVIENCRANYINSTSLLPPTGAVLRDIAPTALVNPGGQEIIGCAVTNYPSLNCAGSIQPKVRVTNQGLDTITVFTAGLLINGVSQGELTVNGTLPLGYSRVVTFPTYNFANGTYVLKFYTKLPNNSTDQVLTNDTITVTITVGLVLPGPISEGFESSTFPPAGWSVINPNPGTITWARTTAAAKTGVASAFINFYNYGSVGHLDYLVAPAIDVSGADSVIVSFDRAYRIYSTVDTDTLMVQASPDCGSTFPITAWKLGGVQLATNPNPLTATGYVPVAADWKNEVVNIRPFLGAATKISVAMVGKNKFGQNLYIDNINIRVVRLLRRDASVLSIAAPGARVCSRTFTPQVTIINKGIDTLKTVKVNYSLNGAAPVTVNFTGALLTNQTALVTFPAITLPAAGNYSIKFYTSEPNGLADQVAANDTLTLAFTALDPVSGPIVEGFGNTNFPPANWSVVKSNDAYTWSRNTLASTEGIASAWIRNRRLVSIGNKDDLYSPLVQIAAPDSVILKFDVAHMTARFPGSTEVRLDTLEVLMTRDCGVSFTSVYKKWGEDLQSVRDPNFPGIYAANDTIGFVPKTRNEWKTETVNLTSSLAGVTGNFQLIFRNINNNGNNTFLDNISITPVTLPARLKQQGYLIAPNPAEGWTYIRHYQQPIDLTGIQVMNSNGQMIWQQGYNGNASNNIAVDLNGHAAGVYTLRLIYKNKVVVQRIVKIK